MKSEILLSENTCKYSCFEKVVGKICTRQSRKVIQDMINTVLLTQQLSNPLWLLSYSLAPARSWAFVLLFYFSLNEKQCTQNHQQYLWGLARALFPTTFLEIAVCTMSHPQRLLPRVYVSFLFHLFSFLGLKKRNLYCCQLRIQFIV